MNKIMTLKSVIMLASIVASVNSYASVISDSFIPYIKSISVSDKWINEVLSTYKDDDKIKHFIDILRGTDQPNSTHEDLLIDLLLVQTKLYNTGMVPRYLINKRLDDVILSTNDGLRQAIKSLNEKEVTKEVYNYSLNKSKKESQWISDTDSFMLAATEELRSSVYTGKLKYSDIGYSSLTKSWIDKNIKNSHAIEYKNGFYTIYGPMIISGYYSKLINTTGIAFKLLGVPSELCIKMLKHTPNGIFESRVNGVYVSNKDESERLCSAESNSILYATK